MALPSRDGQAGELLARWAIVAFRSAKVRGFRGAKGDTCFLVGPNAEYTMRCDRYTAAAPSLDERLGLRPGLPLELLRGTISPHRFCQASVRIPSIFSSPFTARRCAPVCAALNSMLTAASG